MTMTSTPREKSMTPEDVEKLIRRYGQSCVSYDQNGGSDEDKFLHPVMSAIRSVFAERDALQARLEAEKRITQHGTIDWRRVGAAAKAYASSAPKRCRAVVEAGFQHGYTTGCSDSAIAQEQGKP